MKLKKLRAASSTKIRRFARTGLRPTFQFLLITLLFFFATMLPSIYLFDYSKQIGYWWSVLLFGYYGGLTFVYISILLKREKIWIRQQLGDEAFFRLFPGEKRRLERQRLKEQRKLERAREKKLRERGL